MNHLEKILKVGTFASFGDNCWMKFGVSGNLIRKSGLFLQRCASSCLLCLEKSLGDGRAPHRELGCDFNVRALMGLVGCNRRIELGIEMSETELR